MLTSEQWDVVENWLLYRPKELWAMITENDYHILAAWTMPDGVLRILRVNEDCSAIRIYCEKDDPC